MQPQLKGIEIESVRRSDDDLTIQYAAIGQPLEQGFAQLWKVSVERSEVAALDEDIPSAPKHDGTEPVPFGLVQKLSLGWQGARQLSEHGLDRRADGEFHRLLATLASGV